MYFLYEVTAIRVHWKMLELSSTRAGEKDHVRFACSFVLVLLFLFSGFSRLSSHRSQSFLSCVPYMATRHLPTCANLRLSLIAQKTYFVSISFCHLFAMIYQCPCTVLEFVISSPFSLLSLLCIGKAEVCCSHCSVPYCTHYYCRFKGIKYSLLCIRKAEYYCHFKGLFCYSLPDILSLPSS